MIGILTGELTAFKGRQPGLQSVVLPRPPRRKFGGKPANIGRRYLPSDAMRVTEFVAITGIRSPGIRFLLERNHLKLHDPDLPLLSRSSAVAFHRQYVNLSRYAALGTITVGASSSLPKYGLATAFAYQDIKALVVERAALAASIGPLKEYTDEERSRWKKLRQSGARNCPSFLIPSIMGDGDMIIYTTSRKLFFRVFSFPDRLVVRIRVHPGESPRAWRIYRENEEAIRRLLTSFTWTRDGSATVIEAIVKDSPEIESLTQQLGEMTKFFRYKMP